MTQSSLNEKTGSPLADAAASPDMRVNVILLAMIVIYGAAVSLLAWRHNGDFFIFDALPGVIISKPVGISVAFFLVFTFFYRLLRVMLIVRPRRLFRALGQDFRDIFFNKRRILAALPLFILIPLFFCEFTVAKDMIPAIKPFSLDPALAHLDRVIHFGRQPWEWLQPLLGHPAITAGISLLYKLWFVAMLGMCFFMAFSLSRPQLRAQFFVAFVAAWILNGTILAIMLSSAGPCYFDKVYPTLPNSYAGLMVYLHQADKVYPAHEFWIMDYLWQAYIHRRPMQFSGISAMPSLHVSVAFLLALAGWRINKAAGTVFTLFLLVIMAGSVHLGWHYAVDGYAAIATTLPLWLLAGRWARIKEHAFDA